MISDDGQISAPVVEAPAVDRRAGDVFAFHDPCVLGTRLNISIRAVGQAEAYAAAACARREIDRLDAVFNWRDPASEISRLNRSVSHLASADLFAVVAAAERWRTLSGGAVSGRMGRLMDRWRAAMELPAREAMAALASEIAAAEVWLDPVALSIARPDVVQFDLDGVAKGYIVDKALEAVVSAPGVAGAMVDIGGDVRVAGQGPTAGAWRVGLPQPLSVFDNAPACGAFEMRAGAAATSGCGPRDRRVNGQPIASTIDPRTGWPVAHERSASAVAACAMDADALASAMLVLSPEEAEGCLARTPGAAARVAQPEGAVWLGKKASPLFHWIEYEQGPRSGAQGWPQGWTADITFEAPPKDMRKERAFRSPYVAVWISTEDNKPVRTLLLVGSIKEWQESNFIWWGLNRGRTQELLDGRSMSTRGSGTYRVYWDGIDDQNRQLPPGRYALHIETSRERAGHAHRMLPLDFRVAKGFESELPVDADTGSVRVEYRKLGG